MASRARNTFAEILTEILKLISEAKAAPDADISWLMDFETMALTKVREPVDSMAGASASQAPPGNAGTFAPPPESPLSPAGGGGAPVGPVGPPSRGMSPTAPSIPADIMPNPDEFRRALS